MSCDNGSFTSSENPHPPKKPKVNPVDPYLREWTEIVYSPEGTIMNEWGQFYQQWWGPTSPGKGIFDALFTGGQKNHAIQVGDLVIWTRLGLLKDSKGWMIVRDEYVGIYDRLSNLFKKGESGIVLTGSPGIGKSYFAIYTLLQQLTEGKTTLFTTSKGYSYLFHETGIMHKKKADVTYKDLPPRDWNDATSRAWSVIDGAINSMPEVSELSSSDLFVLMTCPPENERYKGWMKYGNGYRWVMNPWSEEELRVLLSNPDYTRLSVDQIDSLNESPERIQGLIDDVGPCPRDIVDSYVPSRYAQGIQEALSALTVEELIKLFKESINPGSYSASHKVTILRRVSEGLLDNDRYEVDFKSQEIRREATKAFKGLSVDDGILFAAASNFFAGNHLAGWVFEGLVNEYIRGGRAGGSVFPHLATMVRNATATWPYRHEHYLGNGPVRYQLENTNGFNFFSCESPEQYDGPSSRSLFGPKLPINLRETDDYDRIENLTLTTGKWYRPKKFNDTTFDSFFFQESDDLVVLWVFQMTIAKSHDGKPSGFQTLMTIKEKMKSAFKNKKKVVNLVLVTPYIRGQRTRWLLPKQWESLTHDGGGRVYIQYVDLGLAPSDYEPYFG